MAARSINRIGNSPSGGGTIVTPPAPKRILNTRYQFTWPGKPGIAGLAGAVALGLSFAARTAEVPWGIEGLIWAMVVLMVGVTLGALISVRVAVDGHGAVTIDKRLAVVLPFSRRVFATDTVRRVALDRRMSADARGFESVLRTPTPRYRIELHLGNAACIVQASSEREELKREAIALAKALACPFEETGE